MADAMQRSGDGDGSALPETPLDCCGSEYLKGFAHIPMPPRSTRYKFSALMFSWLEPLIRLGNKRPIQLEDLWYIPKPEQCSTTAPLLSQFFDEECARGRQRPFLWSLIRIRTCEFALTSFYKIFGEGILYALPMLTLLLLRWLEDQSSHGLWYPYVICVGIFLVNVIYVTLYQGYVDLTTRIGMERRVAAMGLVFRKALRVNLSVASSGQITNLMSNDCTKIEMGSVLIQNFYWQPLSAIICFILLYDVVGVSAVVVLAVMAILVPLQATIGSALQRIRRGALGTTDRRVSLVHEMILGIRLVKALTWERPSSAKMLALRKQELGLLRKSLTINAVNFLLLDISPLLVAVATLAVYSNIEGNVMTASTIFTALSLLSMLRKPLQMFPRVLSTTIDGWVAVGRIQRFLLLPDAHRTKFEAADKPGDVQLVLRNATAYWPASLLSRAARRGANNNNAAVKKPAGPKKGGAAAAATADAAAAAEADAIGGAAGDMRTKLEGISISLGPGAEATRAAPRSGNGGGDGDGDHPSACALFGVVVGGVGTGKSSLLSLILGELSHADDGDGGGDNAGDQLTVRGSVAFVPQVAFILNDTVRQNVLFGRSFSPEWYAAAIVVDRPHQSIGDACVIRSCMHGCVNE